ncbi:MAG: UDP-N-acetylmuramoyl-L-alanine--D-glutamate ligase [Oscillospiraceae bacterium]|nr:UDP-N-acetylmuramoyl-L-alanine--D-glutamate ligase [Oscillospiraceae bacterium]
MRQTFKNYLNTLMDKKVAVIGLGISNAPLVDALLEAGIYTIVRDKRTAGELGGEAENLSNRGAILKLGEHYLDELSEDVIFRTPGLMPSNPAILEAVKNGAELTSEMETFFKVCPCKKIGITGSDGKTTTTSIIAELLKNQAENVYVGGNIGTPLLTAADDMKDDDIAVLELSSFQLISMKESPDIAVITNISPNHLNIHGDLDEYIDAKRNIYMHQKPCDRVVLNKDREITRDFAKTAPADEILFFSHRSRLINGVFLEDGVIYEAREGKITEITRAEDILLPGAHNLENYMAAFAAVRDLVSIDVMRETGKTFKGVEHRIELVRERGGVLYYNDSIASSPTRTIAGLRSFDKKVILIAGGKDKGITFDELAAEINMRVKKLVLTGMAANQIYGAVINAPGFSEKLEIVMRDDFTEAVLEASKSAVAGDIVLLSPACTSFDRFRNFEERGNLFKDIVNGVQH